MRILVMLLLDTLPMLGNVLLLCFFVFFIFGIVGVQLWAGFHHFFLHILINTYFLSSLQSENLCLSVRDQYSQLTDKSLIFAGLLRQRCYINETYQRHLIGLEGFQE